MKGVVLAGGLGTRLDPLTRVTNKHLLPVYSKPMVFYPIRTLAAAGVTDVMVVTSGEHAGDFVKTLRNGSELGVSLAYGFQEGAGGIPAALQVARDFVGEDNCCVILGDNTTDADVRSVVQNFRPDPEIPLAHLFLRAVPDPERFGVAEIEKGKIKRIVEKPPVPASNFAVTGLYMFDEFVWRWMDSLKPSARGELEITDISNKYLAEGKIEWSFLDGFWRDAGTFATLFEANQHWARKEEGMGVAATNTTEKTP